MPSLNLVAVINGKDYPAEFNIRESDPKPPYYQRAAEDAIRKAGITCPRKNPMQMGVEVFVLKIKGTELVRERAGKILVTPPMERMTVDEYNEERNTLLAEIPIEFHGFIGTETWDRGHSAGYEEVINIMQEMVYNLKPCIQNYRTNLLKGKA